MLQFTFRRLHLLAAIAVACGCDRSHPVPDPAAAQVAEPLPDIRFHLAAGTARDTYQRQQVMVFREPVYIAPAPFMTSADLRSIEYSEEDGSPQVHFVFTEKGAETLKNVSTSNVEGRIAIVVDECALLAPTFREPIDNGSLVLTGGFYSEDWERIRQALRVKRQAPRNTK